MMKGCGKSGKREWQKWYKGVAIWAMNEWVIKGSGRIDDIELKILVYQKEK